MLKNITALAGDEYIPKMIIIKKKREFGGKWSNLLSTTKKIVRFLF